MQSANFRSNRLWQQNLSFLQMPQISVLNYSNVFLISIFQSPPVYSSKVVWFANSSQGNHPTHDTRHDHTPQISALLATASTTLQCLPGFNLTHKYVISPPAFSFLLATSFSWNVPTLMCLNGVEAILSYYSIAHQVKCINGKLSRLFEVLPQIPSTTAPSHGNPKIETMQMQQCIQIDSYLQSKKCPGKHVPSNKV